MLQPFHLRFTNANIRPGKILRKMRKLDDGDDSARQALEVEGDAKIFT